MKYIYLLMTHPAVFQLLICVSSPDANSKKMCMWMHVCEEKIGMASKTCRGGSGGGGGNRGQGPRNSESGPPCCPPDRESALIIQWQISCNGFVLNGNAEIKCLSSLLPNQNRWNCKHRFVWMRDLSFFQGCMCPLTKKPAPTWPTY